MTILVVLVIVIFILAIVGTVAHAAGLVDDTIKAGNEYSKYPLDNYQLDFYVDNSWDWLPWNWLDGIGKQVMYGLYAITNFIWTISLFLSNATGYLVQEAYSLDFISVTADSIGKNMQTIAGISINGFSTDGFYGGFLLILILILGIYVAYIGLIKRETTKAIHASVNFVVVFILSAAFIAYAPDYIEKINGFSADISNASLSMGTKIVMPNSKSQGKDSVDLIRDSLFSIQVQQPWLLLQYDNSDIKAIGENRVEKLLSTSPDANNGKDREEIVKSEIEDRKNTNLTITKTINRLGMVFFLFIFNIGISAFVFLLTGIMIFSQVLFIIYAMFLPVSFLLSMIPTFESMTRRAITKLFNTIMSRAGITLIVTTAFSISTMLYTLSTGYPFFLIAFLQIVTFAGIYFKLGDLMSMFSLQSGESQSMGRQILRRPRMLMLAHMHRLQYKLRRSISDNGKKSNAGKKSSKDYGTSASRTRQADHTRPDGNTQKTSFGKQVGQAAGTVMDTKDRIKDTAGQFKEQAEDLPVNAKYALHHGKSKIVDGISDFKTSVTDTRKARQQGRKDKQDQRRMTIAERRSKMEQEHKRKAKNATEPRNGAYSNHERPATADIQGRTDCPSKNDKIENIRRATGSTSTNDRKFTDRPNKRIVKESIEQPNGGNVDKQSSKKERKLIKPEKASIKAERKCVSDSQNKRAFSINKQPQKVVYPASTEKTPQRQFIKEHKITVKRGIGNQKKVKIANAATAIKKRGQKK
ncbi:YtxH domain-containing protein [Clostridium sp. DL-VIII]|uniref:CD3337/EF1877 family mobilome membrane protein n=1 Tax=Clostridium sp. DL-VIII TaxID=641107 RepID=UPI00325C115A